MVYRTLADAYRDFIAIVGTPSCCGMVHWNPGQFDAWLHKQPQWDGRWGDLSPALVERAAMTALDDHCPHAVAPRKKVNP